MVYGYQVRGVFLLIRAETARKARDLLSHLDGETGLARLENDRLVAVELRAQEDWVLHLHKGAEFRVEILQHVVTFVGFLYGGVAATHGDVVGDTHIGVLASPDSDACFRLRVNNVEDLMRYCT